MSRYTWKKLKYFFYITPDGSDHTQRTTYDDDYDDDYDERFCCYYYGSSSQEDDEDADAASHTQMEVEWW